MLKLFRRKTEQRTNGDNYWENWQMLRSGSINPETAQSVSAVYACVSVIAETIGSLPLHLYDKDETRTKAKSHALYAVIHDTPNEYQSAVEFREWMTACYLLRGNAYALVTRGWDGQVTELRPLHPDAVSLVKVGNKYQYQTVIDEKPVRLLPHEVFHLRHRAGDNPLLGVSPIQIARETIDLALSEQRHGSAMFNNGTKLSGVIETAVGTTKDQAKTIAETWKATHAGAANHGGTPVLPDGATFKSVSMSLEDAEWIAARQFSVEEIARLFRVPPTIIGDLRHGNYSNSVELARQFVTISLRRHLVAWEQAIARQLLTAQGRRDYFAEHSVEGLLRGDSNNRATFYKSGIEAGWLRPSEARQLENLPPIEGIDENIHTIQTEAPTAETGRGKVEETKTEEASD